MVKYKEWERKYRGVDYWRLDRVADPTSKERKKFNGRVNAFKKGGYDVLIVESKVITKKRTFKLLTSYTKEIQNKTRKSTKKLYNRSPKTFRKKEVIDHTK